MAPRGRAAVVEVTSDEKDVQRGFRNVGKEIDDLKKQIREANAQTKKANRELANTGKHAKSAFDVGQLMRWVGGLGLAYKSLQLITAELQAHKELQAEAGRQQVTLNSARQSVIRNMPGASDAETQRVLAQITTLARRTNAPEKVVAQSMADALSASGGNVEASRSAVFEATRFLADRPEDIPVFAGALLDLAKVTGTKDAAVNRGFLSVVAGYSRVVKPEFQAQNLVPAMIGTTTLGATARESAALISALTVGGGDVTGRRSGTAAIALAEQLRGFVPNAPAGMPGPNVPTFGAALYGLQQDRESAERFLAKASFEKKTIGPIEQLLLDNQSETFRMYQKTLDKLPGDVGLRTEAERAISRRGLDPLEQMAATDRALKSAAERLYTGNLRAGMAGVSREGLAEVLKASGQSAMAQKVLNAQFDLTEIFGGRDPREAVIDIAQQSMQDLRTRTEFVGTQFGVRGAPMGALGVPETDPERLRRADVLEQMIGELRAIRDNTSKAADQGQRTLAGAPDEDK